MVDSSNDVKTSGTAENYIIDPLPGPNDIVVLGGTIDATPSTKNHDPAVLGVMSVSPSLQMNTELGVGLPVTLIGRVMANIKGPINQGDLLVTSDIPGVGQKLDPKKWVPGCVLGKALSVIEDDSVQIIEIVVGIN